MHNTIMMDPYLFSPNLITGSIIITYYPTRIYINHTIHQEYDIDYVLPLLITTIVIVHPLVFLTSYLLFKFVYIFTIWVQFPKFSPKV